MTVQLLFLYSHLMVNRKSQDYFVGIRKENIFIIKVICVD